VRRTSIESFNALRESGTLGRLQKLTFDTILTFGALTGRELDQYSGQSCLWKRLSELEARGIVKVVGERQCKVTGRVVSVWDIPGRDLMGQQADLFEEHA
jgi:hypothetical protein